MGITNMVMLLQIVIVGVFATLCIDAWALILKNVLKQNTTDWGMVGRWIGHMPRGTFVHRPIGKSSPIANEKLIGWCFHYAIGIFYAWLYIEVVLKVFALQPTLISALIFGLATVVAPWFILQPGLGMGVMARNAPDPLIKRLSSITVHAIFGTGLYIGGLLFTSIG